MIRHIPEGLVPFEDCGYARTPCQPFVGDEVLIDCRCEARPLLEVEGTDGLLEPVQMPDRWRFVLAAYTQAAVLRYRFRTAGETSCWYETDVLKKRTVDSPLCVGKGWALLAPDIWLKAEQTQGCVAIGLCSTAPEDSVCEGMTFGGNGLWTLEQKGKTLVCCKRMELGLRADGTVAHQQMVLSGSQRRVYGTGERFDRVDQQGGRSCGQVVEHFTQQGEWSYLPVPCFLTDGGFGFYRTGGCDVAMRFDETIRIASLSREGMTDYLLLGDPASQLRHYLRLNGQPALPPEWAFGVWISANGWNNDEEVEEQLRQLKENDYPASVMVLEAWSDESTFDRWNSVWSDPAATVRKIREAGLHLVLWQIPVLKALHDCPDPAPVRRDWEEAIAKGYVVRHRDGSPYVVPDRWFSGSLLPDFTHPEACSWWFAKRDHLLDMGVEGFKTDGGEFLFGSDVVLSDGTGGAEAHNLYAMQYERAYHEWMKKRGVQGVTFSRAGYAGAQTVPIHWAGDQLSTWEELQSQLKAGLSAGLSGVLFWSFDIGGFAGELPGAELYLRATAMGCFCPVMQWHAEPRSGQFYATHDAAFNNDRSPWNLSQKLGDESVRTIASGFARLREKLRPELWQEAQFCVQSGRPMMAHLCLDYPNDERALDCHDEYMLGRRLLVAPVTEPGAPGREVYLPEGRWRHFFTGREYAPGVYRLACPLDEALVFEKME